MDVNQAVRELREAVGESQQVFATRLGISMRALTNYEKGRTPLPQTLAKMAHLAHGSGRADLANTLWKAQPPELQTVPFYQIGIGDGITKADLALVGRMLPKLPRVLSTPVRVRLTNIAKPIKASIKELDLALRELPAGSIGAQSIEKAQQRLARLAELYGKVVTVRTGEPAGLVFSNKRKEKK